MDCKEVAGLLPDLLYDELDSGQRQDIEGHLATCPRCAEEVAALRRTMCAMDSWRDVEGQGGFTELVASVQRASRSGTERRARFARLALPAAVGAVAALLFFSVLTWIGTTVERRGETLAISYGRGSGEAGTPPSSGESRQFLLLLHEELDSMVAHDSEQQSRLVSEYGSWAKDLGAEGKLVAGEKLVDTGERFVRIDGGSVTMTDSLEDGADDLVTGFFHIRAESMEQALAIARGCPHLKYGHTIELREIDRRPQ